MKKRIKKLMRSSSIGSGIYKLYSKLIFIPYKNRKTWELNFSGTNLIFDTSDSYSRSWFYPRYRGNNIHEPITTKIFVDLIKPKDIVFDIGAHLGYFSCLAGKLASEGKVYAFDTDLKSCQLLERNAKLNSLNNIIVNHAAVSDKAGVVKIRNMDNPDPGLMISSSSGGNTIDVKSISIDDFVAENKIKPNFIKIDVEGAEGLALRGMLEILKLPSLSLLVEIHVDQLKRYFDTDYKDIIKLLMDNGFKIENIDHRTNNGNFRKVALNTILVGNTMLLCYKG